MGKGSSWVFVLRWESPLFFKKRSFYEKAFANGKQN